MEHSYVGIGMLRSTSVRLQRSSMVILLYGRATTQTHFDTDVYSKALEFIDKATRKNAKALGYRKNKNGRWGESLFVTALPHRRKFGDCHSIRGVEHNL